MTPKLRKSVRTYRRLMLAYHDQKTFREASNYLRSLYQEFGRETVRKALKAIEDN